MSIYIPGYPVNFEQWVLPWALGLFLGISVLVAAGDPRFASRGEVPSMWAMPVALVGTVYAAVWPLGICALYIVAARISEWGNTGAAWTLVILALASWCLWRWSHGMEVQHS